MAKSTLPTNYKDDIMNSSMGGKRRYNVIQNTDGTISLEDATTYDQVGSNFGAGNINAINIAINASADASKIIDDVDTINALTKTGYIAGGLALKKVNDSLANGNISFSVESDGAYATYKVGADTVTKKLGSLSNKKVIEAYDYGLFNLSSIDGYQNFVLWDNLFVVPGKVQFYNPNWVGDIQQTYSYDSNTGILTINTGHGWLRFWQVTVYY